MDTSPEMEINIKECFVVKGIRKNIMGEIGKLLRRVKVEMINEIIWEKLIGF